MADSGMGKTTFLINLLIRYLKKNNTLTRFLTFREFRYYVKLVPLGMPNALDEINKLENKQSTILLLDAFDEDNFAVINYKKRLDEILAVISPFKEVIITCRTQFFPNEEEEPHKTGIFKYGGEKGQHEFKKLYISPFDDNDIQLYLEKKYPIWQIHKRIRANSIVQKSPNLMVRPMLLNYIDDFVNQNIYYQKTYRFIYNMISFDLTRTKAFDYTHTYQIYEILITKWIEREASRDENPSKFKTELYRFSHEVALDIYENRFTRGGLFINYEEIAVFAKMRNINLDQIQMTSRSLLNRNSEGQFKFSHRSILEYFLAIETSNNQQFLSKFNFDGMENVRLFLLELGTHKYIKSFCKKYPEFTISYCTSGGLIGKINPGLISAHDLQNIFFIHFDKKYFNCEGINNVISSFPSLRIFAPENKDISMYSYLYKELIKKEADLNSQLQSSNLTDSEKRRLNSDKHETNYSVSDYEIKFNDFRIFEEQLKTYLKMETVN